MAQEEDPIAAIEGAPKKLAEFLMELYKVMRDQKQQQLMQQQQQASQEAMQKQQQAFMMEQNERLMDVMKQAGIPGTDANKDLAKSGLTRIERLAEDEVQTQAKLDGIDKEIAGIDQQQKDLLAPDVDLAKVDSRLDALKVEQQRADETYLKNAKALNDTKGITPDQMRDGMDQLNQQKKTLDKAIGEERAGLQKVKVANQPPDLEKIGKDLDALDKQQLQANETFKTDMAKLVDTPGMEPDKLFEGMEKLKGDKAKLDKDIGEKRDGLLKAKEGPKPKLNPGEKADQLQALHEKKAGLIKSKGPLQEKMKGIETEKAGLSQGLGGMQMGQGMSQGPKIGGKGMGQDPIMFGGVDLSNARPGSTGETIGKGLKALKSAGRKVDELATKIGKKMGV